jgi:hypothetical protein
MSFNKNVTATTRIYNDLLCDGCSVSMENDHCGGPNQSLNPRDGLIMRLEGEHVEPYQTEENELTLIFCNTCTRGLCEALPALKKRLIGFK